MSRIIRFTGVTLALAFVSIAAVQQGAPPPPTSPANGYDVHVTAPHVVDGVPMGPYHHYCKVLNADPVIQCLVFASTAPDARLEQIEYVIAKSITRTGAVSLKDWNRNWHDHRQEISTGRAQVHGLPPEQAKQVADLMATTDGIIFHLWSHDEKVPGGKVSIAQSVGHLHLSSEAVPGRREGNAAAEVEEREWTAPSFRSNRSMPQPSRRCTPRAGELRIAAWCRMRFSTDRSSRIACICGANA